MPDTPFLPTADPMWGQACLSYTVLIPLGTAAATDFARLQDSLARLWPDPLRLCPIEALHVTVHALAGVRAAFDKEAYWQTNREAILTALTRIGAATPPLRLCFERLRVTPSAIIAIAPRTDAVLAIRHALWEAIPPAPVASPRLDLVHVTLARYGATGPVPATTVAAADALEVGVAQDVGRLTLARERVYPLLEFETVATVALESPEGS